MAAQISDAGVVINNVGVNITPNSLSYTEGFGEQNVLVQTAGNGKLSTVYSNDVETNLGMVKFSMRATVENIALARKWKSNANRNAIAIIAQNADGSLTRNFSGMALTSDFEVQLSADGVLDLEFKGNRPTL